MRICMLTSFFLPTIGGVENHVYNLCQALKKQGHDPFVVHTCFDIEPAGEPIKVEEVAGIEVHRLYLGVAERAVSLPFSALDGYINGFFRKVRPISYRHQIADYILRLHAERPIDILHQHDFISNLFTTKILARKIPIVLTNHTGEYLLLNRYGLSRALLPYLLSHIAYMFGPSQELCDAPSLKRRNAVAYVPNGVNPDDFSVASDERRCELKVELGLAPDTPTILCARRWAPTKGVKYLVEAIPAVIAAYPETRFLISGNDYYGYPAYRDAIMEYIHANHLEEHIILLGDIPYERIECYYQAADIVVLPSLMEATSLSGLEAMSCARPLLGTNVGGIPEIIDDGITGALVPPRDPQAIAGALVAMLSAPVKLREQGLAGLSKVRKEFSWDIIARRNAEVYTELATTRPQSRR